MRLFTVVTMHSPGDHVGQCSGPQTWGQAVWVQSQLCLFWLCDLNLVS